jgi:hypothetical protein
MKPSDEAVRCLPLDRTCISIIVQADHALALVRCARAARLNGAKQIRQAGIELKAAARYVQHAATWLGCDFGRGLCAAAAEAGAVGEQLEAGSQWTQDDIGRAFAALRNAIEALGAHIGSVKNVARTP